MAALSGRSGATNIETDSSASTFSPQSSASATPETPRAWYNSFYMLGVTIQGPKISLDGENFEPTLTRIMPLDGAHYALLEFGTHKLAISERDSAVWDTKGDYVNNNTWTFTTMDLVWKVAQILVELWNDPLALLSVLLVVLLLLLIILILLKLFLDRRFDRRVQEFRDRLKSSDQWHNDFGVPMWNFQNGEVPGHSTFYNDMNWLAGIDPDFNTQMRSNPNLAFWLDNGGSLRSWVTP